ncbi:hypothetical protein C0991_003688, partial [Blastosporella zonata]
MSRRSPSISREEYTGYEFTTNFGIDYNYDPSCSTTPGSKSAFDPYTDTYSPSDAFPIREQSWRPQASHEDGAGYHSQRDDGSNTNSKLEQKLTPPPSVMSIPTSPSPEYIAESQKMSAQLSNPTAARKLLILDLNGTLVYRTPHTRREFRAPRRRNPQPRQPHYQPHQQTQTH